MTRTSVLFLALGALVFTSACGGSYARTKHPQLEIAVEGKVNPGNFELPKIDPAAPEELYRVEILNTGSAPLVVYSAAFQEGGNQYVDLVWNGSTQENDFPVVIEPNAASGYLWFSVRYDPGEEPVDLGDSVLTIITNDYENWDEVDCPEATLPDGVSTPKHCGAMSTTFSVQKVGPVMQLNARLLTFSCVFTSKSETICMDNTGTDPLVIRYIDFDFPSSEFTLVDLPALPTTIPTKGTLGYAAVCFQVRYDPSDTDYQDDNRIRIDSNDVTQVGGSSYIDITIKQKPAVLDISTTSGAGFNLDFLDTASHSITIYNRTATECNELCSQTGNCCGCPILIQSLAIDPPENADWYEYKLVDPLTENELEVGGGRSLPAGKAYRFDVTYARPAGVNEDRNAAFLINYVAPEVGAQTLRYNMFSAEMCDLQIAPKGKLLSFNAEVASETHTKTIALMNQGNAPCQILDAHTEDQWNGKSADFLIDSALKTGFEIPAFGIVTIPVEFSPKSIDMKGYLKIKWEHPTKGATTESLTLRGNSKTNCSVPAADPGQASYYTGYAPGQIITLNGCNSTGGSCGANIYNSGYIWYLLDKPEGSGAYLNTEGLCTTAFMPDVAGNYTISLITYDEQSFLQSDPATVIITVE
jgi:hypothetical protein